MVSFVHSPSHAPGNLCEMLLRNMAHILITNQLIKRAMVALRPECESSAELLEVFDDIVALNDRGQHQLGHSLSEAGAVLPILNESSASPVISWFLASIPDRVTPGVMAAEVISNLRLLVQHLELKAKLAAEEAALVGQNSLGLALLDWSAAWRSLGHDLRSVNGRLRAHAYIADVTEAMPPLTAAIAC